MTVAKSNTDPATSIRLVFELARADNPRLFDELIRFHKGAKRVNRLRVLAYDGLLVQAGLSLAPSIDVRVSSIDRLPDPDGSIGLFLPALEK